MKTPTIIKNLQVWPEDLGLLSWQEATRAVSDLGPGWRLPTLEEFEDVLYPNRTRIPDLKDEYWSSTELDHNYAWYFLFSNGFAYYTNKNFTLYVRAVRDWTGELAIELLLKDF